MQAGKRAAHSARTIAGNQAANARYRRVSRLSDAPSGGGCAPVMFVLFVAALGVGGYFAYKKFAPKERELPKIIDVSDSVRTPAAEEKPKEEPKKPEAPVVKKRKLTRKEQLQKKYDETMSSRREAQEKVAEARKEDGAKPLPGLKGIKFGEIEKGVPSVWGPILPGDAIEKCGISYAVYGKAVSRPVGTLGSVPLVWVTPKTRRIFRIEFFRPLKKDRKTGHDPETATLSAMMAKALKRQPIVTHSGEKGLPGVEYVFPSADTTVKVGEYGDMLKLVIEHEGYRTEAKNEADALRAETVTDATQDKLLSSARYPLGKLGDYKGSRVVFEKGTPRSFCGISFGKTAPEWATVVYPKNGDKSFFLDYARAKCGIFKGFDVGKAKIDPYRGGVYEVVLYVGSGGFEGLDDASYYQSVRGSLDRHYAVKPVENPGKDGFPELVYTKGDLKIVFGPDINGGFRLSAVNGVLAQIAKTKPVEKRRGRR